jgi:hypothetical protein
LDRNHLSMWRPGAGAILHAKRAVRSCWNGPLHGPFGPQRFNRLGVQAQPF